ncbi:peptidyl-prolyl cis-trans isomerase [Flavobacterium sp. J372]|uniref:peptidylprolyl isomerase n=1 Tax=Flavobacterium sp. J372 TaxID=2898436 RepID=UPI002151EC8E|nr:peptidylprolyl isomerase [Flavobacterium sp. J372]MCR5863179.1 peptidyl-prolyl cis-trans isomerase [Flavobacterium sp. J372]
MLKNGILFALLALCISCGDKERPKTDAVARVNDSYLFPDELTGLVPAGTAKADSIAIIKNYIDRWASQRLLYDAAEINLGKERQEEYNQLIEQYRTDLYTRGYLEEIVKQSADTVITNEEVAAYYKANKENFRTTGMLVKLRYLYVAKDHPRLGLVRSRFLSGNKKDLKALNDMSIQFKSFAFNDTTWVDINQVYQKLPFITPENRGKYVSGSMSYQYPDSTGVYMVKVRSVLDKGQIAPYEFIAPTLRQLIINNRKLELIKKFEKEITDDAIKNKKYEVYK